MSMGVVKRAAIYARVSTRDKQSPQMQLDALREFAQHKGFEVVAEHVDRGLSGTKDSRPELNKVMDAARKRRIDLVLCYRFDRFARSVRHLVNALHEFDGLGVEFVSYSENIDTSAPLGRALFAIAGALAELERGLIVERSVEGQRRARERGAQIGRPRAKVDEARVLDLHRQAKNLTEIARAVGVGRNIVARIVKAHESTLVGATT